jgi:hypothetical protein
MPGTRPGMTAFAFMQSDQHGKRGQFLVAVRRFA